MTITERKYEVKEGFLTNIHGVRCYCTHVKVSLSFDRGGINMFTSKNETRGYYIHVQPITDRDDWLVSVILGVGFKRLIMASKMNTRSKQTALSVVFDKSNVGYIKEFFPDFKGE